jgi:3-deoxy-D-manno-octulosonic-acid transferase
VIVGPRHGKFPEVQSLIDAGAAVEVRTAEELMRTLSTWMERPQERLLAGMAAARYVQSMAGATDRTLPPILAALSRREG